jgi:hypothetical protein
MMKSSSRIRGALIVWIASYLFFIVMLVNNFSASHDSIHYLHNIVRGENLFHQHHLLYHFLANQWFRFWTGFFGCEAHHPLATGGLLYCRQHYIIESFTALWGSSVLTVVYLFFRNRFHLTRNACLLGTTIVAFSYGVWFYSVNVEVYMPPLFFILWSLYVLTNKDFSVKDIWKIAVLHSLAILFHQVNILFTIVVLYVLIRNRIFKSVIGYGMLGLLITGGAYFTIGWFVVGTNSFDSWLNWMQGYTVGHDYWQPLSAKTPVNVIMGFGHAFLGGHFVFRLPSVEQYLQRSFKSHGLRDEIFLASNITADTAWALAALTVVFVVIFIVLVFKFAARYRQMTMHFRVINPLIVCLAVYSLFFCFWMPEILEFWILQAVLVWLLVVGMMPLIRFPFRIRQNIGLVILALCLFCINFFGSLRWLQSSENDWYFIQTKKISASIQPGDVIVVEDEWILKDYLRHYTAATIIATEEPGYTKEGADKIITEALANKQKVFYYHNGSFTQSY